MKTIPFLVAFAFFGFLPVAARAGTERPNIIFVMVDNMGHAAIGPYGQREIQTPSLDRMAREGIRFTAAYSGATVCAPARSVLMTGQHAGRTRVRGNSSRVAGIPDHNGTFRVPLEPQDVTIAQVLKARGYVTGMTGKWGLGQPGSTGEPDLKGFDEWFGFLNQNHAHDHYPDYLWRGRSKAVIEANLDPARRLERIEALRAHAADLIDKNPQRPRGRHSHDLFSEFALDFIRRHKDRPFFLYVPYTLVHQHYLDSGGLREYPVPDYGIYADKPWNADEKGYAAMVGMIDRDMGRILALLEELGIDRQTLVFFTSDNGDQPPGADQRNPRLFDGNGGLRGGFGDLYDGGLRVPMLVRWPGRVPAETTSDLLWSFADVLPTLAEVAGGSVPPEIDGVSVLPAILGERQELDRMLYWEHHSRTFQQAVRWGRWKAIRTNEDPESFELYDLVNDRGEQHNVAGANPEIVQKVTAFMDRSHVPSRFWPRAGRPD